MRQRVIILESTSLKIGAIVVLRPNAIQHETEKDQYEAAGQEESSRGCAKLEKWVECDGGVLVSIFGARIFPKAAEI